MGLRDRMKWVIALTLFITSILAIGHLETISKNTKRFYDDANRKINLTAVKTITPRIEYYLTLEEDKQENINYRYSTYLTPKEIKNIAVFLEKALKSPYYNIQFYAYMLFDNERVTLFKSERYLKRPSEYSVTDEMLTTLQGYGIDDFQYNAIGTLKGKTFTDKDAFTEEVLELGKLKKSSWSIDVIPALGMGNKAHTFVSKINSAVTEHPIDEDSVEEIVEALEAAYKKYTEVE